MLSSFQNNEDFVVNDVVMLHIQANIVYISIIKICHNFEVAIRLVYWFTELLVPHNIVGETTFGWY